MNRKKRDARRTQALELLRKLEQEFGDLEGISVNDERLVEIRNLMFNEMDDIEVPDEEKQWFSTPNYTAATCPRVVHIITKHCKTTKEKSYMLYRTIVDDKLDVREALNKLNLNSDEKRIVYTWGYEVVYSIDFRGEVIWSTSVKNFENIIRHKGYKISRGSVGKYDLQKHIYIADVELIKGA